MDWYSNGDIGGEVRKDTATSGLLICTNADRHASPVTTSNPIVKFVVGDHSFPRCLQDRDNYQNTYKFLRQIG